MTSQEKQRDAQNRVIVDMFVKDDTDFLSTFSQRNSQVISGDVADFLENSIQAVAPKEKLVLHIYSDCIDEQEKHLYTNGLHRYYQDALVGVKREYKRNLILSLTLMLVGMAFIALSLILASMDKAIWTEAIDIVAWVFCWEAVDILAFKNRELKIKSLRYSELSNISIEFFPSTQEQ